MTRDEYLTALREGTDANASLSADECVIIMVAAENVIDAAFEQYELNPKLANTVSLTLLITSNYRAIVNIVTQLRPLICIQPIKYDVGIVKLIQYIRDAENYLTLGITDFPVEAVTYRSHATFSPITNSDLLVYNGIDLECEIIRNLAKSISEEVINMVLEDIIFAHSKPIFKTITANMLKVTSSGHGKYPDFVFEINKAGTDIAHRTRRGAGNVLITSPKFLPYLEEFCDFVSKEEVEGFDASKLTYVGQLHNCMQVFCTPLLREKIIIGYKGQQTELDGSYCYALNQPLIYTGNVSNPETFEPTPSFMHKFAKCIKDTEHYRVLDIEFPADTKDV
jgi:hypothetical protein